MLQISIWCCWIININTVVHMVSHFQVQDKEEKEKQNDS